MTNRFVIGLVGSPFGLKGFVKVKPLSGEIGHLLKLQSVIVSKDGIERELQIDESRPAVSSVLMRFAGIDKPEKAETFSGAQLIANREQAAPLKAGEFYIEDLKGLAVIAETAALSSPQFPVPTPHMTIGHITDIIEGGGGELVEIQLAGHEHKGEKRLVPFRKEFFSEISPEKGRITLQNLWILE